MCRPAKKGGRRCPSDTDPIKRAEKNAKRRAKYAAKKAGNGVSVSEQMRVDEALQQEQLVSVIPAEDVIPEGTRKHGIQVTPDPNPDPEHFQPNIVTGTVDPSQLDEDSYKQFGFSTVTNWFSDRDEELLLNMGSYSESQEWTHTEKNAAYQFTSDAHLWINECAHDPEEFLLKAPYTPLFDADSAMEPEDALEECSYLGESGQHSRMLKEFTQTLDSALDKGPKRQRIVYRGVGSSEVKGSVQEWVAEHRPVGTEVFYAGYTSTTIDKKVTKNFSGLVVYEILTPEGAWIGDQSYEEEEREVLLPRNQRYIVVGNQQDETGKCIVQMVAVNSKGEVLDGTNADPIEPLVTDRDVEISKKTLAVGLWKEIQSQAINRELHSIHNEHYTEQDVLNDPEAVERVRKESTTAVLQIFKKAGRYSEAEEFRKLVEAEPDLTPDTLFERLKSEV